MKKGDTMHKLKVPVSESKFVGTEPIWVSDYVPEDYQGELGVALSWYNYISDQKDCRAYLQDWFKTYATKEELKVLASISDRRLPRTYANLARIGMRGFPLSDTHIGRIWSSIKEIANAGKQDDDVEDDTTVVAPVAKVAKKPLIATNFIVSDVNDEIENLVIGEDVRNISQILMPYKMADKHYVECIEKIEPILAEFNELLEVRRLPKGKLTEGIQCRIAGYTPPAAPGRKAPAAPPV